MFTTIKNELKTILESSGLFAVVYNYEPISLDSFPAVCITASSHSAKDETFGLIGKINQNQTFVVKIRVYYGLTEPSENLTNNKQAEAEEKICLLVDSLISLIKQNRNLNNSCDWAVPVEITIGETEREMIVKYAEIILEAHVLG